MGNSPDTEIRFNDQFRIRSGLLFSQNFDFFYKKWPFKTTTQSQASFLRFFRDFDDPGALIFDAPPMQKHDFQENT